MTDAFHSYLTRIGWFRSRKTGLPQTGDGEPLPWLTYPAIRFLEPRINRCFAVFEYGCGQSTLWWAKRVQWVMSCEHDAEWFQSCSQNLPDNAHIQHVPLDDSGAYSMAVCRANHRPDIVVIDGRDRVNCAKNVLERIDLSGVIIWDNTERPRYEPGCLWLIEQGFRELRFWGLGPINPDEWCTSIFYRPQNCLEI